LSKRRQTKRERRTSAREQRRKAAHLQPKGVSADKNVMLAIAALLAVIVGIVFLQLRNAQFISLDDPQYVSANPVVLRGLTLDGLKWAFGFGKAFYWHPLTWISHMTDVEMFGINAGAHHLMNVTLHAANAIVLFAALRALTKETVRSAFVAALFAVHPLHVESVAWIAERKDLLSTLFWCVALYTYARYAHTGRRRWLVAVNVSFVIGLLAKPMILTLPFVLLLLDFWPLKRSGIARLLLEKLSLLLLAVMSVAVTLLSQRGSTAIVALEKFPVSARLGNALVSYMLYMKDMFWPAKLAAFYPLAAPGASLVIIAAVLVLFLSGTAFFFRKSHPYFVVGWLWFIGTLVPVVGFVQAGDQGRADRFTYVPLIGLFISIVWLISEVAARSSVLRQLEIAGATAVLLLLMWISHDQAAVWKDDLTLWERAVAVTRDNYRAENLYGVALTNHGRLDEGIRHYQEALRVWPQNPEAHNNLGAARMDQQRYSDAVAEFKAAIHAKPRDPTFRYNLAVALDASGDRNAAIAQVKAGLSIDSTFPNLIRAADVLGISTPAK